MQKPTQEGLAIAKSLYCVEDGDKTDSKVQSIHDISKRDARNMVALLHTMNGGVPTYKAVYAALAAIHGNPFRRQYREVRQ